MKGPTLTRVLMRVIKNVVKKGEEEHADSMMRGEVIETGPDVKRIKVKDVVAFAPYGIEEVVVDNEKLIMIDDNLILYVYEQKSNTKAKG